MTQQRFPLAPLANTGGQSVTDLAHLIGVTPRTIYRWRRTGLNASQADRAAIAIGSHPALVWPDRWTTDDEELDTAATTELASEIPA